MGDAVKRVLLVYDVDGWAWHAVRGVCTSAEYFYPTVFDDLLLLSVDPTGEDDETELPRLKNEIHGRAGGKGMKPPPWRGVGAGQCPKTILLIASADRCLRLFVLGKMCAQIATAEITGAFPSQMPSSAGFALRRSNFTPRRPRLHERGSREVAAYKLEQLLQDLNAQSGAKEIHLVAHSMGNDVCFLVARRLRRPEHFFWDPARANRRPLKSPEFRIH